MNYLLLGACITGKTKIVKTLIKEGANPDITNENDVTLLMIASQYGHAKILEILINSGLDVNLQDDNCRTALMYACKYGYIECVKLLINSKNIDHQDSEGWTALMLSCENGNFQIVKLLVNAKAKTEIENIHGDNAIHIAAGHGKRKIGEFLIERQTLIKLRSLNPIK